MDKPRPSEADTQFFIPDEAEQQRRVAPSDTFVDGGSQMVVRDLSGEYYQHLDLSIQPGSTTVIIGDNVKARQELVHDLAEAQQLAGSNIQLPKDIRIEFVTPAMTEIDDPDLTLRDYFLQARGIAGVQDRLAELWQLAATDESAMREAGELQELFEDQGGWDAEREIEQLLAGLRVGDRDHDTISLDTRVTDMSSGQVSKAIIGRALFSRAGVVIMDDPSVHLDVASKEWLAGYVEGSNQAIIIATSDMNFAGEVADRVVEILDSKLTLNIGTGLENYTAERARLLKSWTEEAERAREAIDELEIKIRDFYRPAAKKTDNMAQVLRAQVSKLERMQAEYGAMPGKILLEGERREPKPRTFTEATRSGKEVVRMSDVAIMYDNPERDADPTIIDIEALEINRGDRLAIVGGNGSGKSTLLKALVGNTEGMMIDGELRTGVSVETGYYSPYSELPNVDYPLRSLLGQFVSDPMGILSYWGFDKSEDYDTTPADLTYRDQIARAQFALLMAQKPNLLLLDEPTSYLTPKYQQRLLHAVRGYDGTLLVVSHDPEFLANADLHGRIVMPGGHRQQQHF